MTEKTLSLLEYREILSRLTAFTVTESGARAVSELLPESSTEKIISLQKLTAEAYETYYMRNVRPIVAFSDCSSLFEKCSIGALLMPGDLLKIGGLLRAARIAKTALIGESAEGLRKIVSEYEVDVSLEKEIENCVLNEDELSDNASPKLKDIRRKISSASARLRDRLNSYTKSSSVSKYLQDNLVTVRDGRYVVPVKSENRVNVPGLVHDRSSSGATLFIEPLEVVEMNNELKNLKFDEQQEVERILRYLSERVAVQSKQLISAQNALSMLDIVFAKMHFGVEHNCTAPHINTNGIVRLINSRHPLIAEDKVVPVGISVGGERRILTVTGPNTGGKTVCLKTVGLFCLMAYTGMWIPADDGSEIAVFDDIYVDIGDEQSIASSLSTFSSHMVNLAFILRGITANSLVLMDELGAGTDPDEGAALAVGIIKYIEKVGAVAVITTHYGLVKEYSLVSPHIENASMQFDEQTLSPTYKMLVGLPGGSNAIKIAGKLGIMPEVLADAEAALSDEKVNFEKLIAEAESLKRKCLEESERLNAEIKSWENKNKELAAEKAVLERRLESINASAKAEIKRIVANSVEQADELIEQIKQAVKDADERSLLSAKAARKKLDEIKYLHEEDFSEQYDEPDFDKLSEGDSVVIKSLGTTGVIESINRKKREAKVRAGVAIANISFDNLGLPKSEQPRQPKRNHVVYNPSDFAAEEINVIGDTIAEAVEKLEPLIKNMHAYNGAKTLRIIHGKGTGALARGIQNFLRKCKEIASFRYGKYGEGDTGVTIAEVK